MQNFKPLLFLMKNSLSKPRLTQFLSIEEHAFLTTQKQVHVVFSSLYENEERHRAWLSPQEETLDFEIALLEIIPKEQDHQITHRDVLGTLIHLGFTREQIGDIIITDGIYIFVTNDIRSEVIAKLTQIRNTNVEVIETALETLISKEISFYVNEQITVSSMRIDTIISRIIAGSRTKAQEFILSKNVKLNGIITKEVDTVLKEQDRLSIYKYGRVIIGDISKTTKKGNFLLNIKKSK